MALLLLLSFANVSGRQSLKELRNHFCNPSPHYVLVVSHRGDWQNEPENSVPAVMSALAKGVDIVEIDVHRTADNELILMHDEVIDRMTTGKGRIADLTMDSIRKVFLRDVHGNPTQVKVATLRELMTAIKGKRLLVNLDKAWDNFDLVMKVLEETHTTQQVILKGNSPISQLRARYGELIDRVIYMPMVWPEDYSIYKRDKVLSPVEYVSSFIDEFRPKGFEVILKDEHSKVNDALELMKAHHITIWINALWAELCAGHDDAKAIKDPDANWGWIVRKGANVIQTDYPAQLIDYLEKNQLRRR